MMLRYDELTMQQKHQALQTFPRVGVGDPNVYWYECENGKVTDVYKMGRNEQPRQPVTVSTPPVQLSIFG